MYEVAISILKELNELGYISYIIGGYPRDRLLNQSNDDIDICTSATPDIIKKQYEIIIDNSKYGSLQIKKNNYYFEITTFRIELEYHGRYPKIKYTNDILEDLNRRDFTINTFCIDQYGQIHDFLNAESDLKNGIIRCIGDTEVKIKEDPIRILRAIRFSTKLNFKIEKNLLQVIDKYQYLVLNLSNHQIEKELSKMNEKGIQQFNQLEIGRKFYARKSNGFN